MALAGWVAMENLGGNPHRPRLSDVGTGPVLILLAPGRSGRPGARSQPGPGGSLPPRLQPLPAPQPERQPAAGADPARLIRWAY